MYISQMGPEVILTLNVTSYYSTAETPEVIVVCKNACYLKNFVGGKSTLTAGLFDLTDFGLSRKVRMTVQKRIF